MKDEDFVYCGEQPEELHLVSCNQQDGVWEQVGPIHEPNEAPCGPVPRDMVDPICDAVSGEWTSMTVVAEPEYATCLGPPPAGVENPVCDVVSGEWVTGMTAVSADDISTTGEVTAPPPETIPAPEPETTE